MILFVDSEKVTKFAIEMEIKDEFTESRILLRNFKIIGTHINLVLIVSLKNKESDTDFEIVETVSFHLKDLLYIKDSYKRLLNHECDIIGYASFDKKLCVWANQSLYHEIDLENADDGMNHYTCHLQVDEDTINSITGCISHMSGVLLQNKEVAIDMPTDIQIVFPDLIEYVDKTLCVTTIKVSTPHFIVRRKFDSNLDFVLSLKSDVVKFLNKEITCFDLSTEFIELVFKYIEDHIEISGEISDFSSPELNEIKFKTYTDANPLNIMYKSLCELEVQIKLLRRGFIKTK